MFSKQFSNKVPRWACEPPMVWSSPDAGPSASTSEDCHFLEVWYRKNMEKRDNMGVKFWKVRNIELFALFCIVCDVYEPEPTMFWSAEARLTYACRIHIPFKSSVISFRFGIDTLIVRNGKSMVLESSESKNMLRSTRRHVFRTGSAGSAVCLADQ